MAKLEWLNRPIAHRGLHDEAKGIVENTASAFQAAVNAGYAIEFDVQEAGDGAAIVFHDSTLDRLMEASGPVIALGFEQLKRINFKNVSDRLQTLPEVLELIAGRVPVLIEIKSNWRMRGPFEAELAQILKAYDGRAAVMSFDPNAVAAFAGHAPGFPRGFLAGPFRNPQYWGHLSRWQRFRMRHLLGAFIARPHFVAYDIEGLPSLAPLIWRRALNRTLLAWTVRSEPERQRAQRWADAMIFEGFRP
ncbi:MAG TPA: glycerophosphodiester phosphodiesterase [Rhizobiales bacterium]|nr:cytoplasmic glycerophosphodiester phosphodiesterase [bacterium BMS3Bbin10]HDO52975.1 glycerophosphodiester phosphodiesterase [Hyphomicrobiales bacterium]